MLVDVHTHAPLRWLLSDYHAGVRPGAEIKLNRFTEGTSLPRIPEEVIEAIVNRDGLGLLGLPGH